MLALFDPHALKSLNDIADGHFGVSSSVSCNIRLDSFYSPALIFILLSYDITQTASFYKGTPRDLLELSPPSLSNVDSLQEMVGCSLHFKLYSHQRLQRISDLVIENALIGR